MLLRALPCLALILGVLACGPGEEPPPPPFEPIPWDKGQPELNGAAIRGFQELRAIVHLHSHWSHDACDRDPQPGGVPDEDCLADLRDGLCLTRIDVAFLSDHSTHSEEAPLADRLLERGGDELVYDEDGAAVGAWLHCPDGHRSLMLPGIEADLMPLGITEDLPAAWNDVSPPAVEALRQSGAVTWVSHTEGWDTDLLASLNLDGFELYQLHANLDPGIREEHLGLDAFSYLGDVAPFFFAEANEILDPPHPDLAPLGFLSLNDPAAIALEELGQGRRIAISGGTDAHQNVFPTDAGDGERVDSYRRMMRWFNNRLRIAGSLDAAAAREALRSGRNHIVFEVFGTPLGFDFRAERGGTIWEIGDEVTLGEEALRLRVELPSLDPRSPRSQSAPVVTGRLYRATAEGRQLLQAWEDGPLDIVADEPGVYRVEVWITPLHLQPYLGEVAADYLEEPVPWIQTGAIFVRPGNG